MNAALVAVEAAIAALKEACHVSREQFEHTLITMYREGWSIRSLSRYFGASRNAVRRILRAHERRRNEGHDILTTRLKRASKLDAYEPEMKRYPREVPGHHERAPSRRTEGIGLYGRDHDTPREARGLEAS